MALSYIAFAALGCPSDDPEGDGSDGPSSGAAMSDDGTDDHASGTSSVADDGPGGSTSGLDLDTGRTTMPADDTVGESDGETVGDGSTGELDGQTVFVGVGTWGHRGMTVDGETWVDIINEPPPDGNDHTPDLLRGVGYGNGMFVAVGGDANGMIMSTTDGVTWDEDLYPEGTGWLGDVAYLDGIWVAVGGNGIVVRSTDGGIQWSENKERLSAAGRTIIAAQGVFLAGADNGVLAVSTDGLTWNETTDPGGIQFAVAYGADSFVGFASQWNGDGFDTACTTSPTGNVWSPCPVSSASFGRPAAGQGAVVVQVDGGYAFTTDGASWETGKENFPSQLVFGSGAADGEGLWVGTSYQRRWVASSYTGPWQSVENESGFRDLTTGVVVR